MGLYFPNTSGKASLACVLPSNNSGYTAGCGLRHIHFNVLEAPGQNKGRPIKPKNTMSVAFVALASIYVVYQLFQISKVFRSLIALPSGAFTPSWSGNLPHLSYLVS